MFAQPQNRQKFKEIERRREFREEIKNRLKDSNLRIPGFAKLTHTGRIQCQICKTEHPEINSFRFHLREKVHRSALDSLKEELEVQRNVNAHIDQLIKAENGEVMQEETIEELIRDKTNSSLGKRTDEPQLVIEERILPTSDQDRPSAKNSIDAEEPDEQPSPIIKPEDEEAELARLAVNQEPDSQPPAKEPNPPTQQPAEKDPLRNKEQTIENRLKAKMQLMKEKLKSKK